MQFRLQVHPRCGLLTGGIVAATMIALSLSATGFSQGKGGGGGGTTPPPNPEIVYVDWSNGAISVMNADGTNARNVVPAGNGNAHYWPTWAPDGQSIAFFGIRGAISGIWRVSLDGTGLQLLTASTYYTRIDWARTASTDGVRRIVFSDYLPGSGVPSIFAMNPDGTRRVNLNLNSNMAIGHAFWLGDRVGYVRGAGSSELYGITLGEDGSGGVTPESEGVLHTFPGIVQLPTILRAANKRNAMLYHSLTTPDALSILDVSGSTPFTYDLTAPTSGKAVDRWGAFSPDDSKIVFNRIEKGTHNVYLINANGTGLKLLRMKAAMPSWKVLAP